MILIEKNKNFKNFNFKMNIKSATLYDNIKPERSYQKSFHLTTKQCLTDSANKNCLSRRRPKTSYLHSERNRKWMTSKYFQTKNKNYYRRCKTHYCSSDMNGNEKANLREKFSESDIGFVDRENCRNSINLLPDSNNRRRYSLDLCLSEYWSVDIFLLRFSE